MAAVENQLDSEMRIERVRALNADSKLKHLIIISVATTRLALLL